MHDTVHTLKHWYQDPQSMHKYAYTYTHTHVFKCIDAQIHTHMHIYTYIMSAHIHTYTYIHTRIQNLHMNACKARLKRRRGSDCSGSPTWHQEALPFSLSASRQRAVQTTSAYLHWCGADLPSSLSTPAPGLAMPAHKASWRRWGLLAGTISRARTGDTGDITRYLKVAHS